MASHRHHKFELGHHNIITEGASQMIDDAAFYGERNTAHPICGMSLSESTDWDNNTGAFFMRSVKGSATP